MAVSDERIDKRDKRTIKLLNEAAAKIRSALQEMPNHVESAFDPRNDVPALTGALERVTDVSRWAGEEIERSGR